MSLCDIWKLYATGLLCMPIKVQLPKLWFTVICKWKDPITVGTYQWRGCVCIVIFPLRCLLCVSDQDAFLWYVFSTCGRHACPCVGGNNLAGTKSRGDPLRWGVCGMEEGTHPACSFSNRLSHSQWTKQKYSCRQRRFRVVISLNPMHKKKTGWLYPESVVWRALLRFNIRCHGASQSNEHMQCWQHDTALHKNPDCHPYDSRLYRCPLFTYASVWYIALRCEDLWKRARFGDVQGDNGLWQPVLLGIGHTV